MTQRVRVVFPWVVFLWLGVWLTTKPGQESSSPTLPAPPVTANQAAVTQKLAGLQIPFIANQGQRDEQVKFYAPTFAGTVFVTKAGELVYALPDRSQNKSQASLRQVKTSQDTSAVENPRPREGIVLTETLVGSRRQEVKGRHTARTTINSFHGNDPTKWQRNIPTYESVSLGEVYDGVEVQLKAYGNTVEKLFHVKAGAAPEQIRLKVKGGKGVTVAETGELEVSTDLGGVRFTKPVAYQEAGDKKEWVEVAYAVEGEEYGFRLGAYDRTRDLVIDPILAATFLGGSGGEAVDNIVLDDLGNVYVAGVTSSSDFPGVTAGSADSTFDNYILDGFVAKLDADLSSLLVATFLGGSEVNFPSPALLALDSAGHVYVAGCTTSSDFPGITASSADSTFSGHQEAFVVKLDANLNSLLAGTFLGGSETEWTDDYGLIVDSAGHVYVAGATASSDFPGITASSADSTFDKEGEAFVVKLDANLNSFLAATFLGGGDEEEGVAIALDGVGHIYVAGKTESPDFPGITASSADSTFANNEGFVAKLDADLSSLLAATFLGGSELEPYDPILLALDGAGQVYVAGETASPDFPGIDVSSADSTFANKEGFVAKLDADLSSLLATTFLEHRTV